MIEERQLKDRLAVWRREGLITTKEVDQILAFEGYPEAPAPPPPEATHKDMDELFAAIRDFVREHPGATVTSADSPPLLGWSAYRTVELEEQSQYFSISLVDAKRSMDKLPEVLQVCLRSPGGRRRLEGFLGTESCLLSLVTVGD